MSTLKTNNIQHVDRSDPSILLNSDGSVSMGGTVSYEDVTNVDSVGIITAREGVFIPDSKELKIGNTASSPDLKIYHDTSNSYLDNSTGNLYFRGSNGQMLFRPSNSEDALVLKPNGSVELYYDNTKRFETTSTGVKTLGDVSFRTSANTQTILYDESDAQLEFIDNIKASFGTGGDLLIHHNGTVNVIDAATSNPISFRYNGSEQFFIGNGEFKGGDNKRIKLGTGDDFQLFHNGTNSFISNTTGIIQIDSDDRVQVNATEFRVKNAGDTELIAKFIQNGACELYHDNVKKLETGAAGIKLPSEAGGAQLQVGANNDFAIEHDGTNSYIYNNTNSLLLQCDAAVEITAKSGGTKRFRFDSDGLKFGSDTAAANALDDYEEGTWTPVIQGTGSNNSKNYVTQTAHYTKVGRLVTVSYRIAWNNKSADSGSAVISGLPFTINETTASGGAFTGNNLDFPSNVVVATTETANNQTFVYILVGFDSGTWDNPSAGFFQSSGNIRGQFHYITNS